MLLYFSKKIIKGLVAQWTRARGYEPRCQGFESLLAQGRFRIKTVVRKDQQRFKRFYH